MLHHPTIDKLHHLRFNGMLKALQEQQGLPQWEALSFEERLGLLADRELTEREDKRLQSRLRKAKLKHHDACVENIDYQTPRGLDKGLIQQLAQGTWIKEGINLITVGPTGIGKTWLACALAHKACQLGYSAQYLRLPKLFESLQLAHGDGRYHRLMASIAKTDVIILDDWGLEPLTANQRRDLLEVIDDRHGYKSTIVTSQLPIDQWHDVIGDATIADAILDRLIHNAYKLPLKGESMRKRHSQLTKPRVTKA